MNVIQIPGYTIKQLNEEQFSPIGDWFLISEDHVDILARFYNAAFLSQNNSHAVLTRDAEQGCSATVIMIDNEQTAVTLKAA